jgi:hypothetical protein
MVDMITFSGKSFDPENPQPQQIDLLDIAVALSRIPRFTGHTVFQYSVAQHSLLVAQLSSRGQRLTHDIKRIKLLSLLHDADEAYTSDIPSPVKQLLKPAITEVENKIMNAIYSHFRVNPPTPEEKILVKQFDNEAYTIENHYLRGQASFNVIGNPFNDYNVTRSIYTIDSNLAAIVFMKEIKNLLE